MPSGLRASRFRGSLTSRPSGRAKSRAPLNSSVRRQSNSLPSCVAHFVFWLRVSCAQCVVSGWPALSSCARRCVYRVLRALAGFVSSCCAVRAVRAVCRRVAFVVSGSFFVRRPQPSWHCRAFKAALWFWLATVQRAVV
jgi:hypothetical protein